MTEKDLPQCKNCSFWKPEKVHPTLGPTEGRCTAEFNFNGQTIHYYIETFFADFCRAHDTKENKLFKNKNINESTS